MGTIRTGIVATTVLVFGSILTTLSSEWATKRSPLDTPIPNGQTPVGMMASTRLVLALIFTTESMPHSLIHIAPGVVTARTGNPAVFSGIVSTTSLLRGLIFETEASRPFVIHANPLPKPAPVGPFPTGIVRWRR